MKTVLFNIFLLLPHMLSAQACGYKEYDSLPQLGWAQLTDYESFSIGKFTLRTKMDSILSWMGNPIGTEKGWGLNSEDIDVLIYSEWMFTCIKFPAGSNSKIELMSCCQKGQRTPQGFYVGMSLTEVRALLGKSLNWLESPTSLTGKIIVSTDAGAPRMTLVLLNGTLVQIKIWGGYG